jgi:hypothetical protein
MELKRSRSIRKQERARIRAPAKCNRDQILTAVCQCFLRVDVEREDCVCVCVCSDTAAARRDSRKTLIPPPPAFDRSVKSFSAVVVCVLNG